MNTKARSKVSQFLIFAGAGILAGLVIMTAMGFLFFPTLMGENRFTASMGDFAILWIVGVPTALAALIGGLVGGQVSREGGRSSQLIMAIIVGIMLAVPVSCIGFWYTGW